MRALRADRAIAWLIVLFMTLNVADLVLRLVGLPLGGFEATLLINRIFKQSVVSATLLKLVGTVILTAMLVTAFSTMPRVTRLVAAFLCFI
ncbi:MAG TPA: DUF5658 family protein [Ktedonobacterales bacterium]|jgi:hypothetical protein